MLLNTIFNNFLSFRFERRAIRFPGYKLMSIGRTGTGVQSFPIAAQIAGPSN